MIIRRNRNVFQTTIIDTEVYNCVIKVPGPVFLTLRVKILLRLWRYLILYLNFKLSTSPIMVKNSDKLIVNGSTRLLSPIIEMNQFDFNVVERKEPDEMISWNMLLVETLLFWLLLSMMSLRLMIISMRLLTPTVIILNNFQDSMNGSVGRENKLSQWRALSPHFLSHQSNTSHHNVWNLISSTTYLRLTLLSVLDSDNWGGRGAFFDIL